MPNAVHYLWQGVLVFGAALYWALDPNLSGLTSTHVLNTDLLLNSYRAGVCFAEPGRRTLQPGLLVARIRWVFWPLALVLLCILWLPLSGNLLLLLMKLQVLPLAKPLLSFVAHVTNNAALFNWAGAGLLLLLDLYAGCRRCGTGTAPCSRWANPFLSASPAPNGATRYGWC